MFGLATKKYHSPTTPGQILTPEYVTALRPSKKLPLWATEQGIWHKSGPSFLILHEAEEFVPPAHVFPAHRKITTLVSLNTINISNFIVK
jgi:hypothetical protein